MVPAFTQIQVLVRDTEVGANGKIVVDQVEAAKIENLFEYNIFIYFTLL